MEPSCRPTCETFETSLSALIDGELEFPEQLPTIDHLFECASCQEFYRRARTLGAMVVSGGQSLPPLIPPRGQSTEPAPQEIWERIATETGLTERSTRRSSGKARLFSARLRKSAHLPGALQLAAVLVVAIGLWFLWPSALETPALETPTTGPSRETGVVDVMLEEDRGSMSDERFLELTTEILRADRSYHRKMLEVMAIVTDLAAGPEGSGDEPAVVARDGRRRISVGEDDRENASLWSGDRL